MTKIKCSLTQMCKLVALMIKIKLVRVMTKCKINNKWLVHHLTQMSNQVQVLQPTNVARDHPLDTIIGDISRGVQTRSRLALFCEHFSFVSSIEPKKIDEALKDVDWVNAMHEELNNFTRNQVWKLVERPKDHNMIETKWVF